MRYLPGNLEWANLYDCKEEVKKLANGIDCTEFHYRRYLSGFHKNLRMVNDGFRWLQQCKLYEKEYLYEIFKIIESEIIKYELYELMPRHLDAKKKLLKLTV